LRGATALPGGQLRALLTLEQRFTTGIRSGSSTSAARCSPMRAQLRPGVLDTPQLGTLRDVGFGLRFSNSRSALANVLHFDVAFPLDGDDSIKNVQFLIETKRSF
jgi:hypothetical protein